LQPKDKLKDQTYFLYNFTQKHLAHILFPIGGYYKKKVRQMAKKWHLPVAERPDSQEICFLATSDYRQFLKQYIYNSIKEGQVTDIKGKVIGHHQGLPLYTIGQRRGFQINSKFEIRNSKLIPPFYVIAKNIKKNQLIVGFGEETERQTFDVQEVNWVSGQAPKGSIRCRVRIRHQGDLLAAGIKAPPRRPGLLGGGKVKVSLVLPQRGIAPGQAAVFYVPFRSSRGAKEGKGNQVLGGGIISG